MVGNFRVDLTTLLVGLHAMSMAVGAVAMAAGLGAWVNAGVFSAAQLGEGHVWTLVTYPFVHDIRQEEFGLRSKC